MIPTLLVPMMGGTNGEKARVIQTLLFIAGINTLLQALFGTRLPAVVGGSSSYVVPIVYIIHDSSLQQIIKPNIMRIQISCFNYNNSVLKIKIKNGLFFTDLKPTCRDLSNYESCSRSINHRCEYTNNSGLQPSVGSLFTFFSPLGMAPVVGLVGLGLFQRGFPAEIVALLMMYARQQAASPLPFVSTAEMMRKFQSLWRAVPHYLRRLSNALKKHTGKPLPLTCTPIRFGSWMGGDQDGNHNMTAKVTKDASLLSRWIAIDLYIREVDNSSDLNFR